MKCIQCKKEIENDSTFCIYCGEKLVKKQVQKSGEDINKMKYFRVFLSSIYLILFLAISLWVFVKNWDSYSYIGAFHILDSYIHPFYFISLAINLIIIIIFSITLFSVEENIYFSVLILGTSLNVLNFIVFNFLVSIFQPSTKINYPRIIIINALLLIIPVGLIILSIYLRDKYKKGLKKPKK